ncbi:MAG: universal stress protein [Aureisphaera sp.]
MRKILIPTDFSNNAYNAIVYATKLFQNEPSTFYVLHSFENEVSRLTSRVDIGKSEEVIDELYDSTERKLEELKKTISQNNLGSDHILETIASSKRLSGMVNYLVKEKGIDMVVMGTKGQTGAKEVLLGSTTVQLIKKIEKSPLLVIPEDMEYTPLKHIAFATGFEYPYTDTEVQPLLQLAAIDSATVHILHMREDEQLELDRKEHVSKLKTILETISYEIHWLTKGKSKTDVISDYVYSNPVDLLAMIYYKYGFLKSLFRESIVKKVARHPGIPFLMIPASK